MGKNLAANMMAGLITAFVMMSFAVSYGTLLFDHPLLKCHVGLGIQAAAITTIILLGVNALFSSFSLSLAGPDSNSIVLLAVLGGSVATKAAERGNPESVILATVFCAFALAGFGVGAIALLLGKYRQGKQVAYIPFPVTAGFLAGTGLLVLLGGFRILSQTGGTPAGKGFGITSPTQLLTFTMTLGIIFLPRIWKHFAAMPLLIATGIVIDKVFLPANPFPESTLAHFSLLPFHWSVAWNPGIDWSIIAGHFPFLLPLTVVVILTSLLNSAGLELESEEEGDFNRELQSIGLGLLCCGAFGGLLGHVSASRSVLHRRAGATSRFGAIAASAFSAISLFFFPGAILAFPRSIMAALLISTGLILLKQWVWQAYKKLAFQDFLLVLIILSLVKVQGPVFGVLFGIMITAVLFVYNYSRITCIRNQFSSGDFLSNRDRPVQQVATLKSSEQRGKVLILQGYIFFGTGNALCETARSYAAEGSLPHLLLDFRMVQGVDVSAAIGLSKLENFCLKNRTGLAFTSLEQKTRTALEQAGFNRTESVRFFPDLDFGLENMEDQILAQHAINSIRNHQELSAPYSSGASYTPMFPDCHTNADSDIDLSGILSPFQVSSQTLALLNEYCVEVNLPAGETLIRKDDHADNAIFFIERGFLTVGHRLSNGEFRRLRTLGPGSVVGEMAFFSGGHRTADVLTKTACRFKRLDRNRFDELERLHFGAASEFRTFVVQLLAFRLTTANSQLLILQ